MNKIYKDYSKISEIEINKRIAFYEGTKFFSETLRLLIPDVGAYVGKIFNCLRWAKQGRKIIEDICKKTVEHRMATSCVITSVVYNVGSLNFDGRAFLQQNVHHYCQYISEIKDCVFQILNIVYDVGYRQWSFIKKDNISKVLKGKKRQDIVQQLEEFNSVIDVYKELDNFGKHNLILWGNEKLEPNSLENVEFYFKIYEKEYRLSEIINQKNEQKIKSKVVELLDNVFAKASVKEYQKRKYATLKFDDLNETNQISYDNRAVPANKFIEILFKINILDNKITSVSYYCDNNIPQIIYLARLEQSLIGNGILQTNLLILNINEFDVYKHGKLIGKYECRDEKDKTFKYFHFKKFEFKKLV